MTTLIKIIVASILSLTLFSCNFDMSFNPGVKGNGNVITTERAITEDFSTIKATEGLNVILTQSNNESITVEADDNIQELILTEIENGVLKVHTKSQIGKASSKKVRISFKEVASIVSTSGSDVRSTNTITQESLSLKSTSGSDMILDIDTAVLSCKSTSGSDMRLSGKTIKLVAEATSGSDIKAADLKAESSEVKATSGSDVTINTSKALTAKASSGGDIRYYGNPPKVDKNNSSSGNIRKE